MEDFSIFCFSLCCQKKSGGGNLTVKLLGADAPTDFRGPFLDRPMKNWWMPLVIAAFLAPNAIPYTYICLCVHIYIYTHIYINRDTQIRLEVYRDIYDI